MNTKIAKLFLALSIALLIPVSNTHAANIRDLDPGDGVYLQGIFSDDLVLIVRVDIGNNRVKVRRSEDNTTQWVSPSKILSRDDSIKNDIKRTGAAILIIGCLLDSEACKD